MTPLTKNQSSHLLLLNPKWVLTTCLCLSAFLSWQFFHWQKDLDYEVSQKNQEKLIRDIHLSIEEYVHPLQGIVSALHYSNMKISAKSFRAAAESRGFYKNFNGALGFGFVRRVNSKSILKYIADQKLERPNFELRRIKTATSKDPDDFNVIEFIEPIEQNERAIGLVVSDEENRRQAAENAMKTGLPSITKPIQLVQAAKNEPGFLLFLPIYKTPVIPALEKERKEQLVGWAYAPLLAYEMFQFVNKMNVHPPPYQITQIDSAGEKTTMYESDNYQSERNDSLSFFESEILVAGEKWKISSLSADESSFEVKAESLVLFLFLCSISLLIFYYLNSLQRKFEFSSQLVQMSEEKVKAATRELTEQKIFLRSVIDGLPAMVGCWNKDLRNVLCNAQYESVFGKKPEEIYGMHISEVVPNHVYEQYLPAMKKALQGEKQEFEVSMKNASGQPMTAIVRYNPHIVNGSVEGFIVNVLDITNLRKLESENKEKQALLFTKSKLSLLGEMAGGIAHEINNPLAIIDGKAGVAMSIIQNPEFSPEQKEKVIANLKSINQTVMRIAKIIKGLRSFARDSENDPFEKTDLKAIFDETLSLVHEKIKNKGVQLTTEGLENDQFLTCNRTQLVQVMMNLLSNSVDAIANLPEKWIKIQVSKQSETWKIRVCDSGHGIPETVVQKMMNPFFTTKEAGHGTGLGLSISRRILDSHGASFDYELYENRTSFVIQIPANASAPPKVTAA